MRLICLELYSVTLWHRVCCIVYVAISAILGFSEFVIVFGSARLYCMPGALLCSRHRCGHQVVLRDIVHTMHNDHELLYKSWRDALVYNYVLKKGLDMTTFSTCMALFIRNVSSYKQDTLWSWFICVCYTICVTLTVGLTFSLGVLFPVLMDSFHEDRERTGRSFIITIRIWPAETQWSDVKYVRGISPLLVLPTTTTIYYLKIYLF